MLLLWQKGILCKRLLFKAKEKTQRQKIKKKIKTGLMTKTTKGYYHPVLVSIAQ